MKEKEKDFTDIVKAHKNTIFTVCYLFSKDQDEVNDLFQETLINLWRGFDSFKGQVRPEDLDLARQPQHLPHCRAQEEVPRGDRAALNGHQSLHRH